MYKPRIKEMLIPYINEQKDGIRFGGHQMNVARDIEVDDPKLFYEFLKMLDGNNCLEDLCLLTGLSKDNLNKLLNSLKDAGVIYENFPEKYYSSKEEIEYYSRNINFFAWIDTNGLYYNYWEVQYKLTQSKVLLLGAGGTGSHCAESLARMGVGHITIVDFDEIELSNLNRQNYTKKDVDHSKVNTLKNYIIDINPFIKINTIEKKITSQKDLDSLIDKHDLIISCIDKPKNIHDLLDEASKNFHIPWILGGYASTIMNHALFNFSNKNFSEIIEKDINENYDAKMIFGNSEWSWENAVISPIANISGNISALYALYYLTNLVEIEFGQIQHIDFFNIHKLEDFSYMTGE